MLMSADVGPWIISYNPGYGRASIKSSERTAVAWVLTLPNLKINPLTRDVESILAGDHGKSVKHQASSGEMIYQAKYNTESR